MHGRLAILDGVDQLSSGTLSTMQRLIADRDITLPDGTRLLRWDRYDALVRRATKAGLTPQGPQPPPSVSLRDLAAAPTHTHRLGRFSAAVQERFAALRILRVHPAFRMIALARPSAVGSGGAGKAAAWLSPEVLAMFLYHYVRPLNEQVRCDRDPKHTTGERRETEFQP